MAKKIELDFSEMTKPVTAQITPPTEPQEKKTVLKADGKPEEVKPSGYVIALDGPEDQSYQFKDLVDLSGEEFIRFAQRVFPMLDVGANPRDFDTPVAKKRAFDQILRFHKADLFHAKKEEEKGYRN